eukprot:497396-Pyramimonas_sp.AAC.1
MRRRRRRIRSTGRKRRRRRRKRRRRRTLGGRPAGIRRPERRVPVVFVFCFVLFFARHLLVPKTFARAVPALLRAPGERSSGHEEAGEVGPLSGPLLGPLSGS